MSAPRFTIEKAISEGWYKPNEAGGLCMCGCGEPTPIAEKSNRRHGRVKGYPRRFINGHNARGFKHSPELVATRVRYGSDHHAWRGGRKKAERGYIWVRLFPDHPFYWMANGRGYVKEHRLVMALSIGRILTKDEVVHHVNDDTGDNRIENLMLFPDQATHMEHHHSLRRAEKGDPRHYA